MISESEMIAIGRRVRHTRSSLTGIVIGYTKVRRRGGQMADAYILAVGNATAALTIDHFEEIMQEPTNPYEVGRKAAEAAIKKRTKQRIPVATAKPPSADFETFRESWPDYLAGWKSAIQEHKEKASTWES